MPGSEEFGLPEHVLTGKQVIEKSPPAAPVTKPGTAREALAHIVEKAHSIVSPEKRDQLKAAKREAVRREEIAVRDYEAGLMLLDTFELVTDNPAMTHTDISGDGYGLSCEIPDTIDPKAEPEEVAFLVLPKDNGVYTATLSYTHKARDRGGLVTDSRVDEIKWRIDTNGRASESKTPQTVEREDQIEFVSAYHTDIPERPGGMEKLFRMKTGDHQYNADILRTYFDSIKAKIPPKPIPKPAP